MALHSNLVLLATDGSLAARAGEQWVANLQWSAPTSIQVLTVASDIVSLSWTAATDDPSLSQALSALIEREAAEAEQSADVVAARLREGGLEANATTRFGDPAVEILRAIDERQPTLTVLGNRGRSELETALLGSVSQQVVRNAATPVLVARPSGMPPGRLPRHLLVLAPNEWACRGAVDWLCDTGLTGSRVTVLALAGLPAGLAAAEPSIAGRLSVELDQLVRTALQAPFERLGAAGVHAQIEVAHGHPLRAGLDRADALDVDLIVAPGGSLLPGQYPLGEKITRYATRSVLAIPTA